MNRKLLKTSLRNAVLSGDLQGVSSYIEKGATPDESMMMRAMNKIRTPTGISPSAKKIFAMLVQSRGYRPNSALMTHAMLTTNPQVLNLLRKYGSTPWPKKIFEKHTGRPRSIIVPGLPRCSDVSVNHYSGVLSENIRKRVIKAIEDLGICKFANSIHADYRRGGTDLFFLLDNATGKCMAGASVKMPIMVQNEFPMLYVRYLCSSKLCAGAGGRLMQHLKTYAKNQGMTYIGLQSDYPARGFYDKLKMFRVGGKIRKIGNSTIATRSRFESGAYYIARV